MPAHNFIDLTGQRFGRLTVVERAGRNKHRKAMWKCQCDCGNETTVMGTLLRRGAVQSCGCFHKEKTSEVSKINEIGNRYGRLYVVCESGRTKTSVVLWKCQCDCGNETIVIGSDLRSGHTTSCGCIKSRGEETINKLLVENNIPFKPQYTFEELTSQGGRLLRFDYGILNEDGSLSHLIEFDGSQHYDETNRWYSDKVVEHDQLKNDYCIKNSIKLIRLRDYDLTLESLEVI